MILSLVETCFALFCEVLWCFETISVLTSDFAIQSNVLQSDCCSLNVMSLQLLHAIMRV